MANTILHKRSSTSGTIPSTGSLSQGELGINIADGRIYTKNNYNNIINLGVTSISGTSITPSSGNFSNYLAVSGVPVSVSGHNHSSIEVNTLSQEPQGFVNRDDSTISFNDSTRTFTIQPATSGSSYTLYIEGIKVVKNTVETVVLGSGTALNYIHFDTTPPYVLQTKTSVFDFDNDVPIAFIHWNGDINQSTFFGEERHGIKMDSMTHKWIHNTFGMQYIGGLSIGGYTLLGNGTSNSHAQVDISDGVLYQEDIIINITNGVGAGSFIQQLSPIAYIPVYYHSGTTGQWVRDTATSFPLKYNATRAQYNLYSGGTWTTPNVGDKKYFAMWIVATNDINEPILAILGQREDDNLNSATSNNNWNDIDLTNIPTSEIRPLYRLIFTTDNAFTNTPKSSLQSILDIRVAIQSTSIGVVQNDHGILFGLADDDHSQYVHINNARTIDAIHTFSNGLNASGLINAASGNFSSLTVNSTGVSLSGHNHNGVYADIATGDPQTPSNSIVDRAYALYDLPNDWAALWINDAAVYAADNAIFDSFKINMGLDSAVTGIGIINHIPYWNSINGMVADSGQLVWDSTNNRLGIGTITPSSILTIGSGIGSGANSNNTSDYNLAIHHSDMIIISPEDTSNNPIYTGITLLVSRPGGFQGGQSSLDFTTRDRGNNFTRGVMARIVGGNASNTAANSLLGGELSLQTAPTGSSVPTSRLFINRDGNVGIGTTTPSSQLHVVGTGAISSRLGIGTTSPISNFHISAASDANYGNILVSGTSLSTHVGLGGSDTVPFLASISAGTIATSVYGFGMFYRNTEGDFALSRKSGSTSWIRCLNIQRSNGNVGIGSGVQATTVPERLTVDGNIRVADTSVTQGNIIQFNRGGGGQYDYSIGKYNPALAISLSNDSSTQRPLQVGYHVGSTFNPKFHVNGYTGAVGINTTTPSGHLDVAGDVYIRGTGNNLGTAYFKSQVVGDKTLYLGATNAGDLVLNGGGANIQLSSQGGYLNLLGSSTQIHIGHATNFGNTTQIIRFLPAGTEMMRMTTSGTLGIGLPTSSTSYAGNPVALFSSGPYANTRVHIAGSGSTSASAALIVTNSGIDPILYVRNDRAVGINTNTPSGQLHVVGSGIFSSGIYANNIGITGNMVFATNTNGNLIIKPNGDGALQADNTGNSRGLYSVDLQRSRASVSGVSAGSYSVVVGGHNNRAANIYSIVVGGQNNTSSGISSTIGGGQSNTNTAENGTIAGGIGNTAAGYYGSCVGGGYYNTSSGYGATVAGGKNNNSTNNYSCIGGGVSNTASSLFSTIGGGNSNTASSYAASTVGGGQLNTASNYNATVCGGYSNTASGGSSIIGGGRSNSASGSYTTVAGGRSNTASNTYSTVGGGYLNNSSAIGSTVSGGRNNTANASTSTVAGGYYNTASGSSSTVGGGRLNTASGSYSTITGGKECVSHQYGEEARSSGKFVDNGDAQVRKLLMRGKTNTTNNTVLLTLDGSLKDISTIDNSCIISHHRYDANDSTKQYTWLYNIKVIARHISATTPTSAAYKFEGILESSSAAGVILLGNTKTVIYEDNADFDCNIYEYNTNSAVRTDGLYIEVSNSLSADEDIYWVAYVEILEVGITEYDAPVYY